MQALKVFQMAKELLEIAMNTVLPEDREYYQDGD